MSHSEHHSEGLYYVIPSHVFNDNRISPTQLKVYALISGLARSCGYCYATNKYLAKRLECDERNIRLNLEKLEKFGHIRRTIENENHRKIFIVLEKNSLPPGEKFPTPVDKNSRHSNRRLVIERKQAKERKPAAPAACLSIEEQIKKCKSIKAEDKEPALAYFKANPEKFEKADKPLALLITIVKSGDHLKKTRSSEINENREWARKLIDKTNLGEQFCIGKANVSVSMSACSPDYVIKLDDPEFKKLILYRIKQRLCDTKISLLGEYI